MSMAKANCCQLTFCSDVIAMSKVFLLVAAIACVASATNEEGKKFLEANKGKDGVVTLASGLQYKILNKGAGAHHPTVDSSCECHYEGTLIDGTEFDSSVPTPPSCATGQCSPSKPIPCSFLTSTALSWRT